MPRRTAGVSGSNSDQPLWDCLRDCRVRLLESLGISRSVSSLFSRALLQHCMSDLLPTVYSMAETALRRPDSSPERPNMVDFWTISEPEQTSKSVSVPLLCQRCWMYENCTKRKVKRHFLLFEHGPDCIEIHHVGTSLGHQCAKTGKGVLHVSVFAAGTTNR